MTTPPQINPNASYFALQGYGNNPFTTTPQVPKEGINGVGPKGPAAPAQRSEAYEGQAAVYEIAQNKAAMAKLGLGGNPHATETLGNKLNVTEYDMFK